MPNNTTDRKTVKTRSCVYWRFRRVHRSWRMSYVLSRVKDAERESGQEVTWWQQPSHRSQREARTVYGASQHTATTTTTAECLSQEMTWIDSQWNFRPKLRYSIVDLLNNKLYNILTCPDVNVFYSSFYLFFSFLLFYYISMVKSKSKVRLYYSAL